MNEKKIVFRVDASIQIGTGHVMRCLTLADALRNKGAQIQFLCREHAGNLIQYIQSKEYVVNVLAVESSDDSGDSTFFNTGNAELMHSDWLGTTQIQDAKSCQIVLEKLQPHWLIVDHYSLDRTWQVALQATYSKLMVIDDLSDRYHQCDILLDQTFDRKNEDYISWVPDSCKLLLGAKYALLRPEFAQQRETSLKRRQASKVENILITMGGVDPDNVTGMILEAINDCDLPVDVTILVVMGATAPHIESVKIQAQCMRFKTIVKSGVNNMAELMTNADIGIGAAGSTSWERCCLGLPSLLFVLAENQKLIAKNLQEKKVVRLFENAEQFCEQLKLLSSELMEYSSNASQVTDGKGVERVVREIYE